jgi:hypothetical protein
MKKHLCVRCESQRTKLVNHGFDGAFLLLFLATIAAFSWLPGLAAAVFALLLAAKTLLALFRWRRQCAECGSMLVIPADTPRGRSLTA